jgi:hypothetical protein
MGSRQAGKLVRGEAGCLRLPPYSQGHFEKPDRAIYQNPGPDFGRWFNPEKQFK